jgi:hypothetical protein
VIVFVESGESGTDIGKEGDGTSILAEENTGHLIGRFRAHISTMKMDDSGSSETYVMLYYSTLCHNPEDNIHHFHLSESF